MTSAMDKWPPPPDSWRSLRQATYPQLLHHLKRHDQKFLHCAVVLQEQHLRCAKILCEWPLLSGVTVSPCEGQRWVKIGSAVND